jgi:hypothetical protein
MACKHESFEATCSVHRLENTLSDEGLALTIDLHAKCFNCGEPVRFKLPFGLNLNGAAMSIDGTEARLGAYIGIPKALGIQGFSVEQH